MSLGPVDNAMLETLAERTSGVEVILVVRVEDGSVRGAWVREGTTIALSELARALRDTYRAGEVVTRLTEQGAAPGTLPAASMLVELSARLWHMRRAHAHLVTTLFDANCPLGMARFQADRLAYTLAAELLLDPAPAVPTSALPSPALPTSALPSPVVPAPVAPAPRLSRPALPSQPAAAQTVAYAPAAPPPPSPSQRDDLERVASLLAYAEVHAVEPHVVKLRIALRAGLTPLALDNPLTLRPEAIVRIEAAVEEVLGTTVPARGRPS